MEHSSIGPSGAAIKTVCAGSRDMQRYAIEGEDDNFPAREGNCAHVVGDKSLREGIEPHAFIGQTYFDVVVTQEMADFVKIYTDYCRKQLAWARIKGYAVTVQSEILIDLSWLHPDCFGTTDFRILIQGEDYVETIDLKYGRRLVYPKDNRQLIMYALGTYKDHETVRLFRMTVVQPRAPHRDGPIRSVEYDRQSMTQWAKLLSRRLHIYVDQGAEAGFTPGEHCRDCPGFGRCKSAADHMSKLAVTEVFSQSEAKLPLPSTLTPDQIDTALKYEKVFERWFKELRAHGEQMAMKGCQFHEHKLVERFKRRQVKPNALDTLELMHGYAKEDLYKPQPKTVNQLRDVVKKEHLNPLLEPLEKVVTLVPLNAAGTAVSVNPADMFDKPAVLPKDIKNE